jgi:hypothetical protein
MGKRRKRSAATLQPLPSLVAERPPLVQRLNEVVMKSDWIDPDDNNPTRRTARTVSGYRRTCPLRRCLARLGEMSRFTDLHVRAADRLRCLFDGAMLGFSALKDWRPVTAINYRPATGPTTQAMQQLRCRRRFDQVWALFTIEVRAILALVVLHCQGVTAAAAMLGMSKALVIERLTEALDLLADHWDIREVRRAA